MVTITDPRPQRFGRVFEKLAAKEPVHSLKIKAAAEGLWPSLEGHKVDRAAMACAVSASSAPPDENTARQFDAMRSNSPVAAMR